MDQSLDEILAERQQRKNNSNSSGGSRGPRGRSRRNDRREDYPRDGVRKSFRDEPRKLDDEWVHDRYDESSSHRSRRPRGGQDLIPETSKGSKIRVDNLHYELTEQDLQGLFEGIGPVARLELKYDNAGRSDGTAFVTYESQNDAREAVNQFNGANARGQPIRLTIMPSGSRGRNTFGGASQSGTGRSLADRITRPRSQSPRRNRDMDDEASRKGIDRYVPGGGRGSRSRSPFQRPRRDGGGRRPGERRGGEGRDGGRQRGGRDARSGREGRTKKTQEELDAEMADYFGGGGGGSGNTSTAAAAAAASSNGQAGAPVANDDDIDMIE